MKKSYAYVVTIVSMVSSNVYAWDTQETQTGTTGGGGSEVVNQTTTLPAYSGSGYSVGGYSSTTVTGGSTSNGSGMAVPDNTRGSSSSTTYGVGVTVPLD
ncbi:MAG: hypothetical protein JAY74_10505 [Candidatus Thiodiazotropha taylori]|nr:hypothetical protein [Candidatus Thiodiazotropha taylori]